MRHYPLTRRNTAVGAASERGFVRARGEREDAEFGEYPIVGTWLVQDPNAPFPYHLYAFNADGTMQQANPDGGDPRTAFETVKVFDDTGTPSPMQCAAMIGRNWCDRSPIPIG